MGLILRSLALSIVGVLNPRMLWLSLRPFLIVLIFWGLIGWIIWIPALAAMANFAITSTILSGIENGFAWIGFSGVSEWAKPILLMMLLIPLVMMTLLVVIAFSSVPAVVKVVASQTPYQGLVNKRGGSFVGSFFFTLWSCLLCLFLLMATLPIWWIPPFFAVLPPLLWGWLTMRLMSYDVLAHHASAEERADLLKKHRWNLLVIGIVTGMMGAVPTFFWAGSILSIALFPFVSFIALWVYSLIFIFAALWFTHYLLDALKDLRSQSQLISQVVDMEAVQENGP